MESKLKTKFDEIKNYLKLVSDLKTLIANKTSRVEIKNKISEIHEFLTHPGKVTLINSLSQSINLKTVNPLIKEVCEYCEKCQKEKDTYFKTTKIDFIKIIPDLYECISIDIKRPIKYRQFKDSMGKQ
ncbi:hypothetical protein EQH57_0338 [Dictyocoela roeselum]|nr:hypothetical protein EQH57_0338 [Dictyocoela roeselum]